MLLRRILALFVALGPLLIVGQPARPTYAASFAVTSTADEVDAAPGNGACASASGACTLRAAVMEANALGGSNLITLSAGTYTLSIAGRGEDAAATGDLDVNGGTLEVVGAGVDQTIIDANRLDRVFHLGPVTPPQFTIRGVTIRDGNAVSTPPDPGGNGTDVGGGIRVERNSALTVEQARFVNNDAGARGGAIGMPTSAGATAAGVDVSIISRLTDVTMEDGTAGVEAGGFFSNRTAVLTRVRVVNNRVLGGLLAGPMAGTERGGGIANSGDLTLTDVVVDGNSMGAGNGGGIGNRGDPVANIFGTLRMTNVTVSNNQSELGGGIANGNGGTMIATNVTVSGNRVVDQPGGVVPTNVTAGGIVNLGNATLTHVTVANNQAVVGGGIVTVGPPLGSGAAATTLRATILANNAGGNCLLPSPALPIARALTSAGDNISSDGSCGLGGPNDRNSTDPLLGALASNGGFTPTHALLLGSPAIDGVQGGCPPPDTDQRGQARPRIGSGGGPAVCDIGAFELQDPYRFTLTVSKAGSGVGTVTSDLAGIACGIDCQEAYLPGEQVTLTAAPGQGNDQATFAGWSGACAGTGPCQVTLDAAKTVTARFERVNVGVQVGRQPGPPPGSAPTLVATLTARAGCGTISGIGFGQPGRAFDNARVTITSPAGGPVDQTAEFSYVPPAGTTSVSLTIQRINQSGGAIVSPIRLLDGCGEWRTFVGGGPDAFR